MSSKTEKAFLYVLFPLLILAASWLLFLQPRYQDWRSSQADLSSAREGQKVYESAYKVSTEDQQQLAQAFPDQPNPDDVKNWLTELATSNGGNILLFERMAQEQNNLRYRVRVNVTDPQTKSFLDQTLQGVSRDSLLPLARRQGSGMLIEVDVAKVTPQPAGQAEIAMEILIPANQ